MAAKEMGAIVFHPFQSRSSYLTAEILGLLNRALGKVKHAVFRMVYDARGLSHAARWG